MSNQFNFKLEPPLDAGLFSDTAWEAADKCSKSIRSNKPSQIRRFYDELVQWDAKIHEAKTVEEQNRLFQQAHPFIRMLKAKVAYAHGRKLIDNVFKDFFDRLIDEIHSPTSLRNGKLLFEAFMGFLKYLNPKS